MGSRIAFYRIRNSHSLQPLLTKHYQCFRNWWLEEIHIEIDWTDENEINANEFIEANESLPDDFFTGNYQGGTYLVSVFIGEYLSDSDANEEYIELTGPLLSRRQYAKSTELVCDTGNKEFIRLWNFIISGRLINGESKTTVSPDEEGFGYLTPDEQLSLKQYIENTFGNASQMEKIYNAPELLHHRKKFEIVSSAGTTTHAVPERLTTGLEVVWHLLAGLKNNEGKFSGDLIILFDRES
ncbi:MAG: hypothetical protein IM638_19250 [Bacteroidetes bacterium]|nr:hypothetical protein [Bacteroidota bacterium]